MPPTLEEWPATNRARVLRESRQRWLTVPARYFDQLLRHLSRETTSGRFVPQMDGLRFIAIGMVVLFHLNSYLMAKAPFYERDAAARDWLCRSALVGFHGVELFFVISGFILALPFAAHRLTGAPAVNLRKYYLRRLTRLEPPYVITILLLMLVGLWFSTGSAPDLGPHLAASLFYLHNLIYGRPSTVLGVAWSLEIEVQFYVLVPALTLLFAIRSSGLRRFFIVLFAGLAIIANARLGQLGTRFALSIAGYLQFFLVGFLLADVFLLEWKTPSRHPILWDCVALLGWPALMISLQSEMQTRWLFPLLVFILYCAAFQGRWTSRALSHRFVTAIGGMCYSIYLVHYAVISAVGRFSRFIGAVLPNPLYLLLQFAMVGAAILVLCGAYFCGLERPCMRRDWPQKLWKNVGNILPSKQIETKASFAD